LFFYLLGELINRDILCFQKDDHNLPRCDFSFLFYFLCKMALTTCLQYILKTCTK